eukprot:5835044-Pyramimonas_sp.AAC.1
MTRLTLASEAVSSCPARLPKVRRALPTGAPRAHPALGARHTEHDEMCSGTPGGPPLRTRAIPQNKMML